MGEGGGGEGAERGVCDIPKTSVKITLFGWNNVLFFLGVWWVWGRECEWWREEGSLGQ